MEIFKWKNRIAQVINFVKFIDGIAEDEIQKQEDKNDDQVAA